MVRVAFSVLSLLLLGSFAATAAEPKLYRDMDGRFIVNVPEGWTTAIPKADSESEIALMMTSSADEKVKGGACFVAVKQMSNTRDAAQADLDEAFGEVMNDKFWKSVFAASGIKDAKIENSGNRMQKGRKVFYVVATVTAQEAGTAAELATGRQEVHPVPGSLQFVQCVAAKSIYKQMEPAFNAIFASFEPKPNQLIVQAPTTAKPSVLTLAATEGGTTRILAQNTANVPALGTGVTAGIAVVGSGAWEICEGVNYSGTCSVVTGETAQPLRIGSVRRYIGGQIDVRDTAAAIAATTTAAFKTAPATIQQAKR
jgi:hypothetical protein